MSVYDPEVRSESSTPAAACPVVEVLVPFYGDFEFLRRAVASVLAQADGGWRLTVVDDGTECGVSEWFDSIRDGRVRYLRNDRNLGVSGNFNRCLELAAQPLILFLGSDDVLLPNYIGAVRELHARYPHAAAVQPAVEIIDERGRIRHPLVDTVKRRVYSPRVSGSAVFHGEPLALSVLRG
ncbi:MAG: glycosyltransferase family 2 protein, partial [Sciscionella sp.]